MASTVPASLRSAGIVSFAARAAQVEKAKPAVAYWCNYWIVQQIVTKGLHNADDESKAYTASLMDRLEQAKSEHGDDDAIIDDVAAKAYLEQFGLEVFGRADNAIRANKASKQTADTFRAAFTFLELLQIWPPLDPEIAAKIKFAKYHTLRIAKAIKAGEDPNLSNPPPDPTPTEEAAPLDPEDPEVRALAGLGSPPAGHQPTIEEVPDEHQQLSAAMARTSNLDESLHPSRVGSAAPAGQGPSAAPAQPTVPDAAAETYYQPQYGGDVSPLEPSTHGRSNSVGGGYFPQVSQDPANASQLPRDSPGLATLPPAFESAGNQPAPAPVSPMQSSPTEAIPQGPQYPQRQHQPPPPQAPSYPPQQPPARAPSYSTQQHPPQQPQAPPPQALSPAFAPGAPQQHWQPPAPVPAAPMQSTISPPQQGNYVLDDEAVAKAQKHARWAISALNFEDVNTAVKELQGALKVLGAG